MKFKKSTLEKISFIEKGKIIINKTIINYLSIFEDKNYTIL